VKRHSPFPKTVGDNAFVVVRLRTVNREFGGMQFQV